MNRRFENRLTIVWLALSAITLGQLALGERAPLTPNAIVTASAVIIALVKVRVIVREFMEVRHAPALLGRATDLWLVATGVSLLGSYFVGRLAWG